MVSHSQDGKLPSSGELVLNNDFQVIFIHGVLFSSSTEFMLWVKIDLVGFRCVRLCWLKVCIFMLSRAQIRERDMLFA